MPIPTASDEPLPNPAQPSDLANRDYTGPASETVQQTRLDEAWRALRRERFADGLRVGPSIDARVGTDDLAVEDLIDVVCAAALRVLRNPEGAKQESGTIDDYTESRTLADASIDVYFTAAELRRLAPEVIAAPTAGSFKYS